MNPNRLIHGSLFLQLLLLTTLIPARADTITGTGWKGTSSSVWSDTGNWDSTAPNTSGTGDRNLFFGQGYANAGGTGSTTANNDLSGWHGYRITFQDIGSDASAANDKSFTITGNSFTSFDFGGNFPRIENDSFVVQTFNLTSGQTLGLDGLNGGQKAEINPVNGDITISSGTTVDLGDITQLQIFGSNSHTLTFNGPISSSGNGNLNTVALLASSTVVFAATNTYGGDTFVLAGTLRCATNNAITNSSFVRFGGTNGTLGANFNLDGGLSLGAKFNIRPGSSGTKIIANTSGTTGNATFSGNMFLDDNVTLFANTGGGNILSGPQLDLKNQTLTISGTGSNVISGTLTNSTGSGKLAITATGPTTLSGVNYYAGGTTLSSGALLNINSTTALGTGTLTLSGGATNDNTSAGAITLANNNALTLSGGSLTFLGTHDLNIGTGTVTISGATRTVTVNAGTLTFGGGVTDAGGARQLTKAGPGALVLNAAAGTWTGGSSVDAGTLIVGNNTALGTGNISLNGGTLTPTNGTISLANPALLTASSTIGGANNLTFSDGFTNSGGSRTLTVNNTGTTTISGNAYLSDDNTTSGRIVTIGGTGNTTISAVIANNSAANTLAAHLVKTGAGILTLSAANTYTGGTTISGGALQIGAGGTSGSVSSVGITNNGALAFNRTDTFTVSSLITGTGSLTNAGSGILILTGANTMNGPTTISAGTIQIGAGGAAGALVSSQIIDNGALAFNRSDAVTYGAVISGSGAVTNAGGGAVTLSANNPYSGTTKINSGELIGVTSGSCSNSAVTVAAGATNGVQLASAGSQWTCSGLTYNSGTACADFNLNGFAPSTSTAPIFVNGNAAFNGTLNVIVRSTTGVIALGQYPLIKYTGTLSGTPPTTALTLPTGVTASVSNNVANKSIDLVVTTGNTLTWAVGNGGWDVNVTANWKNTSGSTVNYLDGNAITLDDTASGATPITVSLGVNVTPAAITANVTNKNYTISPTNTAGVILGSGPLVKNGTGTFTVATTNTTYAGAITVNAGTLGFGGGASLGTGPMTLNSGTTVQLPNSGASVSVNNPITIPAGASVTFSTTALGNGVSTNITSGDNTSVINISGSVSFSSTARQLDPFTGTVNIPSGATLRFSATSGGDGSTNASFVVNGTLQPRNANITTTLGSLSGSGALAGPQTLAASTSPVTYSIGTNNASTTFSGQFREINLPVGTATTNNPTTIVKVGTGTLTLSGISTNSGTTTVNVGALIGVTGGALSNSAVTVNTGATNGVNITTPGSSFTVTNLTYGAGTETALFAFGANTPSTTVAPLFVQNNVTVNGTLNVAITGSSTAIPVGTYPLIKYVNTLTGSANSNALSLPLGVTGVITNDTVNKWIALIVTNVTTPTLVWSVGTTNWDFTSVVWTNPIASSLTAWSDINYLAQFDDTASGTGPFTVTLNTNVNPLAVVFTNNANTYTLTGNGSITGSGAFTKAGTGTLIVLTTNTATGGTAVTGGTLQGNSATLLGSIADNASLVFDQAVNGSNNAVISGTGSVTKQNSGTLALGGNNSFTGTLNVNAGMLAISAGANVGGARASATTNSITINGATLQATNGAATITLPSNAGITVGAGGATIDVASGITLDYPAQPINGFGALVKNGAGTFQIDEGTASSTYSGLTLNAGGIAFNKSSGGLGTGSLTINGGLIRTTGASSRSPNNSSILVNGDFTLGSPTTAAISFANGGAWTLANGNRTITVDTITATITGSIGDGGSNYQLIKAGTGTLALGSASTFGGGISQTAGNLNLGVTGSAGSGSTVSWSGGTIQVGNGAVITNAFNNGTATTSDLMMDCPTGTGYWAGPVNSSGSGGFRPGTTNLGSRFVSLVYGTMIFSNNANFSSSAAGNSIGRDGNNSGRACSVTFMNNSVGSFTSAISLGGGKSGGNVTVTIQDNASLSSGTGTFDLNAITSATAAGLVNLNGGTLSVGSFIKSSTGAGQTSTLSLNGGTLKATQSSASFLPVLTGLTAIVSTNGGTLNDNGFNITIAQPLTHDATLGGTADGGLAKSGTGVTTLTATNNYTGPTTVNAGTLLLTGALGTNTLTVNTNATLNGNGIINGATTVNLGGTLQAGLGGNDLSALAISNSLALAGTVQFNLNRTNTPSANKINGLTSVTYGGTLTVTNLGPALQPGDSFTLFSSAAYSGGFTTIVLPSVTAGLGWNTNNLAVNGTLSVISLLSVTVSPATTNVTYGTNVVLTANTSGSGPFTYQWYDNATNAIAGETNSTLTLTSPAVAAAGTYTVIVGNGSGFATNTASLAVTAAALGITANNDSKTYGSAKTYGSGSAAFTPSGLQNGETVGTVTITATSTPVDGTATNAPVGTYTLTPGAATGGTFNAANYNITYYTGTLTVNPLPVILAGTRAYDGTTNANAAILSVANVVGTDDVNVASGIAGLAGASPGSQAITSVGTLALGGTTAPNYTLTGASGSVIITAAGTTVGLVSSENPAGYLDSLTFTANVAPTNATGSVTFFNGATPFSTNTLALGSASSGAINSILRGTNTITVIYSGDVNFSGATNSLSQIVTNHPPVAANVGYYRGSSTTWKVKLTDLATNATDVDTDTLTVVAFGTSTNGIMLTTNSGYAFYVNTNLVNDQFTYTVSDGNGGNSTAAVTLTAQAFATGQNGTVTVSGSSTTVSFAGIPGFSYTVQRSTNLVDWAGILTTNAPSGGVFNVIDNFSDLGGAPGSAYYRLQYNP
jgi:autotransporter-associated beta strand protein